MTPPYGRVFIFSAQQVEGILTKIFIYFRTPLPGARSMLTLYHRRGEHRRTSLVVRVRVERAREDFLDAIDLMC